MDVLDEHPVNFQEINREVLEVGIGRKAAAKIIEREIAAMIFEFPDKALRFGQIGNGLGFGDFKADFFWRNRKFLELVFDMAQTGFIAQRVSGEIDRAEFQCVQLGRMFRQPAEICR